MKPVLLLLFCWLGLVLACNENVEKTDKIFSNQMSIPDKFTRSELIGAYLFESSKNFCRPGNSDCEQGLSCVANSINNKTGVCLKACNYENQDCPENYFCMPKYDLYLKSVGNYCRKQQKFKNMPCAAPGDPHACKTGLQCLATLEDEDESGKKIYRAYKCVEECLENSDCSDDGEQCLSPSFYRLEFQKDESNKPVICVIKNCEMGSKDCSCKSGFSCRALKNSPTLGMCTRQWGVCGAPVALPNYSDFSGNSYLGETCNEMRGRYCSDYKNDSKSQISVLCRNISSTGEGMCLGLCSTPSLDLDLDNKISGKDKGIWVSCPENYVCKTDISRKLSLYKFITYENKKIKCNITKCELGKTCPEECGLGDAECLPVEGGVCGAPFGLCQTR